MRPRGTIPTPRHILSASTPHRIIGETPAQWLWLPKRLSFWLNNVYGICATAEEAFKCACDKEVFITDATVLAWAKKNNVLNGAYLTQVMDIMKTAGFAQNGKLYNDGDRTSVDWTNAAVLQNAISKSPVKLGVAADQLDNVVPDPPENGWIATGFHQDTDEDHCTGLCGFGSIEWLTGLLKGRVPSNVDGTAPGYAMFTWDSIGVIDVPSLLAITGEAWVRWPTTVIKPA